MYRHPRPAVASPQGSHPSTSTTRRSQSRDDKSHDEKTSASSSKEEGKKGGTSDKKLVQIFKRKTTGDQEILRKEEQLSINTFRVTVKVFRTSRAMKKKVKPRAAPPGFHAEKMKTWLQQFVEEHMEGYRYSGSTGNSKVKELTSQILSDVKEKELGRYKYVCYVAIGDDQDQGLEIATRCLSNTRTDDYVSSTLINKDYYVVAILHAIHFD